jgi:hypothetical protein
MKALRYASLCVLALTGCTVEETQQLPDENAPAFDEGQGQEPAPEPTDTISYPGPQGYTVGSIIKNFALYGFANHGATPAPTEVQLSHFYNPTGSDVFPPGSKYGEGTPKPKAIVLMMSAVWCGPCNDEANLFLPVVVPQYAPEAVFVATLIDGPQGGVAATLLDVENWAVKYQDAKDVFYPLVNDPKSQIMQVFEPAFPGNMIIRTSDMRIIERVAGSQPASAPFWTTLQQVIDGTYVE